MSHTLQSPGPDHMRTRLWWHLQLLPHHVGPCCQPVTNARMLRKPRNRARLGRGNYPQLKMIREMRDGAGKRIMRGGESANIFFSSQRAPTFSPRWSLRRLSAWL